MKERLVSASASPMCADAPDTIVLPESIVDEAVETPWRVLLFDDDIHTFEDVILQLMRAVGCTPQQAERHAWTVHTAGKDCVYDGEFFECLQVQGVLDEIKLVTQIEG